MWSLNRPLTETSAMAGLEPAANVTNRTSVLRNRIEAS
jgi:hypothetical protein